MDGVEESCIVGLGDGPEAALIMDMEDLEGFCESEHDGAGMTGRFDCEVWSVGSQKFLKLLSSFRGELSPYL